MSLPSILVTGGTGSFGSAFVRHCLTTADYRRIIVFSRDEYKQDVLQHQLPTDPRLRWFLGDVRDGARLTLACRDVQVVVHAAALKQVPALEYNPTEAVRTNVDGAVNVMTAALATGVERVLALSTDKAVHPSNLYGATKLCMERTLLAANAHAGPWFSIVRYGNVAGSRGSVIPRFRECRQQGHALPVTDPAATRFWITVPQAVTFVAHAVATMTGGELFVPEMPSVRIVDVAQCVSPEWTVTGLRPGEKVHEQVIAESESVPGLPSPYTSDTNSRWLEGDALREAVATV